MFNNLKGWEWLIIVALILLLFGAKRLPDAARGLGRSLRIFKAETKGLADDNTASDTTEAKAVESSADAATTAAEKPVETPAPEPGKPAQS